MRKYFRAALGMLALGCDRAIAPLPAADVAPRYSGQPLMRFFSEREIGGAPRNHAVALPPSGLVYVANNLGLREFDGVSWRVVRGTERQAIFNVATDAGGRVYYSGPNHFGVLTPGDDGFLCAQPLQNRLPEAERDLGEIRGIEPADGGAYFLCESRTRVIRLRADGSLCTIPLRERGTRFFTWQGRPHVASPQAVYRLDGDAATRDEAFVIPIALVGRQMVAVFPRPDKTALVVLRTGALRPWPEDGAPRLNDVPQLLGSDIVTCVQALDDGTFAMGTRTHGLLIVGAEGRLLARYQDENAPGFGFIGGMARDAAGGLWVAGEGGLARVPVESPVALHGPSTGLRGGIVLSLGLHRGRIYVGTTQAIFARDGGTGIFSRIAGNWQNVTALLSTNEGLLVGGVSLTLLRDNGAVENLDESRGAYSLLRLPRDPDRIVAATTRGLHVLRRGGGTWRREGELTLPDVLQQLTMDDAGWLWAVLNARQVVRIDWRQGVRLDAPLEVLGPAQGLPDFRELQRGIRLVLLGGTVTVAGTGVLLRHDPATDRFRPETRVIGLAPTEATQGFLPLGDGTFWFTRATYPRGAGLVRPAGSDTWKLDPGPWNGLEAMMPFAAVADPGNHTVWLAGPGLASFDLSVPPRRLAAPVARVRKVSNEHQIVWGDGGGAARALVLAPEQNALTFAVAAPYYPASAAGPASVQYRTQLEGFDRAWSAWDVAGTTRVYTNLPPGVFTFRAQARGEDSQEAPVATLSFRLLAPWWRQAWFLGMASLTGIGAIAGATRWMATRALRRRVELLEAQSAVERERLRLARDLHDEVGSGLGRVILFAGEAERAKADPQKLETSLARVRASAQELVLHAREIVWAVSPQHDSLASVIERLGDYAEETLAAAGIVCAVARPAPEQIPPVSLGSESRHSLFLAIKEAVHNCVKYSEAKTAELRLAIEGNDFVIRLRDQGRGFAPAEKRGTGCGLPNISARLEALGGSAEITGEVGQGTTITLRLPLPRNGR